ncbi:protein phosphatase 2C and cyclic nucleotide-binding/kinase domain-containing protein [Perilla frutescens var. hirtella]|uniref:Protein phosphatase 2C and cyclic nucleotide-binding/kinase domain-containing protein n=1 Tax=Perilla frutescens var. hirtella TaxID=608512 RepID=A0AAD4J8Y9_PERFH|nr:protein phosphatase 2C and cyclic nucleotide-binding/kinase domain-containing protein [Perilla frutescens var. hirtella]
MMFAAILTVLALGGTTMVHEICASLSKEPVNDLDTSTVKKVQLSDLEWRTYLYCTDCSDIGLVCGAWLSPLDETCSQFCAASASIALEGLHKIGILYHGVSPDDLAFDQT